MEQGSSPSPKSSSTDETPVAASVLPSSVEGCHALIAELSSSVSELHDAKVQLSQKIEELNLTVTRLMLQLQGHRRERHVDDPNQTKLDWGDDGQAEDALKEAAQEAEIIIQEYTVQRKLKPKKLRNEQLPEHLPRVEVPVAVPEDVSHCPEHGPRKQIGEDRLETLKFIPPKLYVEVRVVPKFACEGEPQCGVKQPERATGLVEGNRYGTCVAAAIVADKFAYHMPTYRQQDRFASSGWTPGRSTLLNLINASSFVLEPLAEHYRRLVLADGVLGTDDTTVTLLLPPEIPAVQEGDPRSKRIHEVIAKARQEGAGSVTARMWAYRAVTAPVNVFDFTVSRHRDGPDDFLKNYRGKLMADCYSGYQGISLRSESRILRGACWAHARRKVFDGRSSHPLEASHLLAIIGELYDIEGRGKPLSVGDRLQLREEAACPVLERLRLWLASETAVRVLPKTVFGQALGYLRNHWEALMLYTTDGRMPIDNNDTEQLMKQIALGRKNWLFVGSVAAGCRAATLMTIVSTAHRNDLDVWAYLKDVLDQLLAGSTDYRSLQADIWKQSHPECIRTYRAEERRERADAKRIRRARRRVTDNRRSS